MQTFRSIAQLCLIVFIGMLGAALFELLLHFGAVITSLEGSAGLAAWAQAVGGILAIIGAFSVASLQSARERSHAHAAKRERALAALAMMDAAAQSVAALAQTIPNVETLHSIISTGIPVGFGVERASRQLERLPVWELGDANAVAAVDFMLRIMLTSVLRAQEVIRNPPGEDAADPLPALTELQLDAQRAGTAREQFRVSLAL